MDQSDAILATAFSIFAIMAFGIFIARSNFFPDIGDEKKAPESVPKTLM